MTVLFHPIRLQPFVVSTLLFMAHIPLAAHDLFLRPNSYSPSPNSTNQIVVFNGSFAESMNTVPESLVDVIYLGKSSDIVELPTEGWHETDSKTDLLRSLFKSNSINLENTNRFELPKAQTGTLALGVSLFPSRIAMERDEFLDYLKTEAYLEIDLDEFGFSEPDDIIRERYLKTAKTLIQIGNQKSNNVTEPLGQIIEIVPLTHPGNIKAGDTLDFQILLEGESLADQPVATGMQHKSATRTDEERTLLTSNENGVISLPILRTGTYWMKLIHLRTAPEEDSMDFNSYWASLTFEIIK